MGKLIEESPAFQGIYHNMNKREIFAQLIEIESENDRLDFLQQACGDDAKLRDEILALVKEFYSSPA